jgi:hypothetical protein
VLEAWSAATIFMGSVLSEIALLGTDCTVFVLWHRDSMFVIPHQIDSRLV